MAGWYRKGSVPKREEGREQRGMREERREEREERREMRQESRGKREERREKRQTSTTKISRSKDAMVGSENGGMVPKRVGP